MLDAYKELEPVVYGENAIKYLTPKEKKTGEMCFSMHWHDRVEILRVTSGCLELHLGEEKMHVLQEQAAIIGPRTMHGGFAGENGVEYDVVMFELDNFYNLTRASAKYIEPLCNYKSGFHALAVHPKMVAAINRLVGFIRSEQEENSLFAVGTIYEIIGGLYKYCQLDSQMVYKEDEAFRAVLDYVNNHFGEHISAKDISERFGYNETYFCRRFKAITGITVMKYIQILRMEEAQRCLRSTDDEIGSIAWECGYADISYFSNCFKKYCGYTPTQFRRKYRSS